MAAGQLLNRRRLREQADRVEPPEAASLDVLPVPAAPKKRPRAKSSAEPKGRKPRPKKAPPRMRARWGIFDASMKQVAIFDYNQRVTADETLANLLTRKKGVHFLQIVKDQMPEPAPVAAP